MTKIPPIEALEQALRQNSLVRILDQFETQHPDAHLKDLVLDSVGPGREVVVGGLRVVNFGSDSFLGLDRHPRVREAIRRGLDTWGTHNGASRAFASVRANLVAEEALARWMGVESTLIYPSVMLANLSAIPGLVGRRDVVVLDEQAHHSMQEAAKIAASNGSRVATFAHSDPDDLARVLDGLKPYRCGLVCIDGVYSMGGDVAPTAALNAVAKARSSVLYVDDAHGTGVLGDRGRGTVKDALGGYDNAFVVGSLSKAFSCAGAFIGGPSSFHKLLKIRSSSYVFGGPVVPPYLEAITEVVSILESSEYDALRARLDRHIGKLSRGLRELGLDVIGGKTPIVSVRIGDEAEALNAGKYLFDCGYYVQSVLFPAVPYHLAVLRIQCNANHEDREIAGLLEAFSNWSQARRTNLATSHGVPRR